MITSGNFYSLSPRFFFNRFQDEAYLYDKRSSQYLVFTGIAADILHTLHIAPMDLEGLQAILYSDFGNRIPNNEQISAFLDRLRIEDILLPCERGSKTNVEIISSQIHEARRAQFFYIPLSVNLFINGRCNQRCSFCFLRSDLMRKERKLDKDSWFLVIEKIVQAGVPIINIGGMEPLLDFNLAMDLMIHAKKAGCVVGMITNGTVSLSNEQLDQLREVGCKVGVSLQSYEPVLHDNLTVTQGAYCKSITNIKRMVEHEIDVGIQTVALRNNALHLKRLIRFLESINVKSFTLQNLIAGPWCRRINFFNLCVNPERYEKIIAELERMKQNTTIEIDYEAFPFQRPGDYYTGSSRGMKFRAYSTCSAGKTSLQIAPSGDVYPCPATVAIPKYCLGNILRSSLGEIWHNATRFRKFRRFARADYSFSVCQECDAFDLCFGGCPITAERVNGNPFSGDPRCPRVTKRK